MVAEQRVIRDRGPSSASATPPGVRTDGSASDGGALSPAQRRIWFLDRFDTTESAYNISRATRLRGPLDVAALREAHEMVAARHEILRTRYPDVYGVPSQVVDPPGPIDLEAFPLESVGEQDLIRYLTAESERRFDLHNGPVWRVRLVELGHDDHVLLTVIHHIAADGWSFPILRSEVSEAYRAIVEGEVPDLPDLALQYRDAAASQLVAADDGREVGYWRSRFDDDPDPIRLPWDRPRTRERTTQGAWSEAELATTSEEELVEVARRLDVSPFVLGLALFAGFLRRFSDSDDVVIGIPSAERATPASQQLIGPFVNTLPIRLVVPPTATMRDVVASARSAVVGALDHSTLPFEEIVRLSAPRRDPSHSPLFQVMYQYREGAFRTRYVLPGIEEAVVSLPGSTSKFDLLMEMSSGSGAIRVGLNHSSDLFDDTTGRTLAEAFSVFAEAALRRVDGPLAALPCVHPWQREWLLHDLNDTSRPYASHDTITGMYARVAAEHGSAPAIIGNGFSITHGELAEAAAAIATRLREAGVVAGEAVGLQLERSATFVAAALGILQLGAVYVPLDPSYPGERLGQMTDAAGIRYVLAAGQGSWQAVELMRVAEAPHPLPTEPVPAYVMFTSGSTGQPKGVMVPHRAVIRLVDNTDYVTLRPGDVVAHLSNLSFDAATFEIWGALLNGATLAIIDRDTVISPRALCDQVRDQSVTTMFMTTALFDVVAGRVPAGLSSLREVLFGGERCDPVAVRNVLDAGPPQRLIHVYGPTETTTFASWHEVRDVPRDASTVPIGGPISNTTLHVLDSFGQLVPPGITGELFIGGDGVATGYLNDPVLTGDRFVADPFSDESSARLYRTGDLVKRRQDGAIEFVGRIDRQIKLRGFRVEPGEIESGLLSQPDVARAVVMPTDTRGEMQIAAWVEPRSPGTVTSESLRAYLASRLPAHMVPASITVLDQLPMSPNGKIDVDLLPAPSPLPRGEAAETETEAVLVEAFSRVLGVAQVGRSDSFFDLGGHSLLAVELIAQIDDRLDTRVPLSVLFEAPTPASLAAEIEGGPGEALEQTLVPLSPGGSGRPVFIFHHPSGTVLAYRALTEHLGHGRPVYGVQAEGVDGVNRPRRTVEEMARHYASMIAETDESGDYRLIGHSLGGLLAWETARQLQLLGREVSMLALLDTNARERIWRRTPGDSAGVGSATYRAGRRALGDVRWGTRIAWFSLRSRPLPPELARIRMVRASSRAFDRYRPEFFDGSVIYYLASGQADVGERRVRATWGSRCRQLEIVRVPGTHSGPDSLLNEPHVSVLGRELDRRLDLPAEEEA